MPINRPYIHKLIQTPEQLQKAIPPLQVWFLERLLEEPEMWQQFGYSDKAGIESDIQQKENEMRGKP